MTLFSLGFVPLPPGSRPGFDHADVYVPPADGEPRLFVAHTGADRIDIIDCGRREYLRALTELPGVAGVLVDSAQDRLFSSDRGCARASVYRCSDETLLGRIAVGPHRNGLAYDCDRRQLFVFNLGDPPGVNSTVSVVAVDELEVIATISLPGRPRWAVYDPNSQRVYANVQRPSQIVVLDAVHLCTVGALDVPAAGPHGLALSGDRLFCAADEGVLLAIGRDSGTVEGNVELAGEPDVIMHDAALGRLYVAVGSPGVVHVVDERRLELLETLSTEEGAHTIGWDPVGQALYAFLPHSERAAVFVER
jgi:DNA-binding beta-propeller fold protein YncE